MKALTALFLIVSVGVANAQEKLVVPNFVEKPGTDFAWSLEIKFQAMGNDAIVTGRAHRKVVKVYEDKSYDVESWLESGKVHIAGSDQEQPENRTVKKHDKDGNPVEADEFGSGLDEIIAAIAGAHVPEVGAAFSDTWKLTDHNNRIGSGTAMLVKAVKVGTRECVQVDVKYAPKEGGSAEGTVFIEKSSGLLVEMSAKFTEVNIAPGIKSDGTASLKFVD